jgi:DnaK suppressor protein
VENDPQNGSEGAVDIEPGEAGDVSGEAGDAGELTREFDVEVLDAIEEELADVERALDRLGAGTYGRCETCGMALTDEELVSAPASRFCRACRAPRVPDLP